MSPRRLPSGKSTERNPFAPPQYRWPDEGSASIAVVACCALALALGALAQFTGCIAW